jgi:hypothetical protein
MDKYELKNNAKLIFNFLKSNQSIPILSGFAGFCWSLDGISNLIKFPFSSITNGILIASFYSLIGGTFDYFIENPNHKALFSSVLGISGIYYLLNGKKNMVLHYSNVSK